MSCFFIQILGYFVLNLPLLSFKSFAYKGEPIKLDYMSQKLDDENGDKKGFDLNLDEKKGQKNDKCEGAECGDNKENEKGVL